MPSFKNKSGQQQQCSAKELVEFIRNREVVADTLITLDDGRTAPAQSLHQLKAVFDEIGPPPLPEPVGDPKPPENTDRVLRANEYYEYATVAVPYRIVVSIPAKDRARADLIKSKSCESYADFINVKLQEGWEICAPVAGLNTVDVVENEEENLPGCLAILFPFLRAANESKKLAKDAISSLGTKDMKDSFELLWFRRVKTRSRYIL